MLLINKALKVNIPVNSVICVSGDYSSTQGSASIKNILSKCDYCEAEDDNMTVLNRRVKNN